MQNEQEGMKQDPEYYPDRLERLVQAQRTGSESFRQEMEKLYPPPDPKWKEAVSKLSEQIRPALEQSGLLTREPTLRQTSSTEAQSTSLEPQTPPATTS